MRDLSEDSICECGTKKDAFDIAFRLFEEMADNNCLCWAMQVSAALTVIMYRAVCAEQGYPRNSPPDEKVLRLAQGWGMEMSKTYLTNPELTAKMDKLCDRIVATVRNTSESINELKEIMDQIREIFRD